jgi:dethiobiotin synthetase
MADARGLFVTGTDTGVGKTLVTAALLRLFAHQGVRVVGMKPVAAGCKDIGEGTLCEDAAVLAAHASIRAPGDLVNPYCLRPPIAPHIAARQAGVSIDMARILDAYAALRERADMIMVEGVGGFMVPLNDRETTADLARALALPVVLVVGMRLGCLSHALLTARAIKAEGLTLAGWVASCVDPDMSVLAENVDALVDRIQAPLLGVLPFQAAPDPKWAASRLQLDRIP